MSQETVTADVGKIDPRVIQDFVASRPPRCQSSYQRWADKERYIIEKYAAENGSSTAIRKFKPQFLMLTEITIQIFKRKYYEQLKYNTKEELESSQSIPKYFRPLAGPSFRVKLIEW